MEVLVTDKNKSFNRSKNTTQRSKESSYTCKICGAPAMHLNFGVISCPSCKMFFKRNAEIRRENFTCDFNGDCEVNITNRHICSYCRLAKCFANGMQTQLIRCSLPKKNTKKQKKKLMIESITTISNTLDRKNQTHQLPTLNLLQWDQSILTIDQWNILSNLIHCYDEQSGFLLAERFISEQNILPFKLRFKYEPVREFVSSLINKAQLLFEKNHDFRSLCSQDRSILLRRQMKYVAILSFSFVIQQTHLIEYPAFRNIIKTLFGKITMSIIKRTIALLNFDIPFLKLALAIICFSSFDYTIYENIPTKNLTNIKPIIQTQNMYIELAWRYLIYEYNSQQAIIYFSNLMKYIFVVNDTFILLMHEEKKFTDIIDSVIEKTEQILTVCI